MTASCSEDEFIDLWRELGTKGTALHLGINERSVRDRKAKIERRRDITLRGNIPEGHAIKGKSTLRDPDGNIVMEWIKTAKDSESIAEIQSAITDALKDEIKPAKPVKAGQDHDDHLMTLYPVGDHHFGMLAWGEETGGEDYDLSIAESLLNRATGDLVARSPASKEAAILLLGDFLHYDGFQPVTPTNKHLLDADSRFPKMVRAAVRAIRHMVNCVLQKHENVKLVIEIGNHDMAGAIWLMEAFNMYFEREPRVTVDTSPRPYHCFTFGKCMIGTHHGHGAKMNQLPLVFAADWPEEWGSTTHRTIHTGHVHHDHIKENPGVFVESHGILAPGDAYAANNGYRSKQSMKAIVLHKKGAEVARLITTPEMLEN